MRTRQNKKDKPNKKPIEIDMEVLTGKTEAKRKMIKLQEKLDLINIYKILK